MALAGTTERNTHGFTQEQLDFLLETIARKSAQGFDRPTQMWLIGGLVAIGIAVAGVIWSEIGSVRDEVRANRAAIAELAKGQARIEAILEERLPRDR